MSSMASPMRKKPHVVCIPYPAQGHISPMMKLAKLLHFNGFHITFVNTEHNHRRFLKSRGAAALNGLPSFRFETITDGLPPSDPNATQHIPTLSSSVRRNCLEPFKELLSKLREDAATSLPDAPPPVSWIVSDCAMIFAIDVSKELGIPLVLLWTASACAFMGYSQYRRLIDEGIIPLKDSSYMTNGYLNKVIGWIPGLEGICLKDIPSIIRTTDKDDLMLNLLMHRLEKLCQSSAPIIFHTFDALEHDVLEAISTTFALPIYSIGPLQLLLNQINNHDTTSIGSNLWPEQPECLRWLDLKDPNSVIYINFGSLTIIKHHQFIEFAWGLAKSNQSFLWVMRPDLVTGESSVLPPEFVANTRGRGFLASWCDQERVLIHPSIGGFLTHCGWNSTIESLTSGVPLICWPNIADQMTNCWFCCGKWGVGMEMNEDVTRDEVEGLVRELMEGEKGRELRKKAGEWKRLAEEAALSPNGSSYLNLDKLINQVFLSQN
ncbi:hypothetical protein Nepgr_009062 [Nepenthes gracilis]|uniref:Glycosyltransferase n=1 Tax=Nepenthes gracilis TaxID=150966 RepID=A0AAD3SA44_NEPGR|nr:hypothetical protein Nepgr_009062 [Nepenthes gracilis]